MGDFSSKEDFLHQSYYKGFKVTFYSNLGQWQI